MSSKLFGSLGRKRAMKSSSSLPTRTARITFISFLLSSAMFNIHLVVGYTLIDGRLLSHSQIHRHLLPKNGKTAAFSTKMVLNTPEPQSSRNQQRVRKTGKSHPNYQSRDGAAGGGRGVSGGGGSDGRGGGGTDGTGRGGGGGGGGGPLSRAQWELKQAGRAAGRGHGPRAAQHFEAAVAAAREAGALPDVRSCNQLLRALGDRGLHKHMKQVYLATTAAGVAPTLVTYGTLVSRAGKGRRAADARFYYGELLARGLRPDVPVLNALMNAEAKGPEPRRALAVLADLRARGLEPTVISYNSACEAWCRAGRPEKARELVAAMRRAGVAPNERTLSILVNGLCKAGRVEEALAAFRGAKREGGGGSAANEFVYATLIDACGKAGRLAEALELYRELRFDYAAAAGAGPAAAGSGPHRPPNVVVWTALLDAACRGGQLPLAFALLEEMMRCGVAPNAVTLTALFRGALRLGDPRAARQALDVLRAAGLDTKVAYTTLLSECSTSQEQETASQIIQALAENKIHQQELARAVAGGSPGVGDSSSSGDLGTEEVVALLARWGGDLDRAFAVLEGAVGARARPDAQGLRVLAGALASAGALERARAGLAARRAGPGGREAANGVLLAALTGAAARAHRLTRAAALLPPPPPTPPAAAAAGGGGGAAAAAGGEVGEVGEAGAWAALARALDGAEARGDPRGVFAQMVPPGDGAGAAAGRPGLKSFTALLKTITKDQGHTTSTFQKLAQMLDDDGKQVKEERAAMQKSNPRGSPEEILLQAFLVFQEMRSRGIAPDRTAYNCLLSACAKAADLEKAWEVYKQMIEDGIVLDVISYTTLINVCAACGETDQAEDLFASMQQRTNHFSTYVRPSGVTYATLMRANNRAHRYSRALDLFWDMEYSDVEPTLYSYREALKACYETQAGAVALQIYKYMKERKVRPDNNCLLSIVKLLEEKGKHKEARDIRKERSFMQLWEKNSSTSRSTNNINNTNAPRARVSYPQSSPRNRVKQALESRTRRDYYPSDKKAGSENFSQWNQRKKKSFIQF